MIEAAYREGEALGLAVWGEDEAGPFPTRPYPGQTWAPAGEPVQQPHEYVRAGMAKQLTLFHPATGQVRVKGVTSSANAVLHPWLKEELTAIVEALPAAAVPPSDEMCRALWQRWQAGLSAPLTLPASLPPLRLLLVLDNLAGHLSPDLVRWFFAHGIMPLYTPLGGSWLNMTESVQRVLGRRALAGHDPQTPQEIITWLEATARAWNREPTPFVWGGRRAARRARSRQRRHALGGSAAYTPRPIPRRSSLITQWLHASQMTH